MMEGPMFGGFVFLCYFLGAMLINYLIVRTWADKRYNHEYPELENNSVWNWVCLCTILFVTYGSVFYGIYVAAKIMMAGGLL